MPFNPQQQAIIVIAIMSIVILSHAVLDMYVPSFPAIANDLITSADKVQLTMAMYLLGFSVSHLVYGPLSERFGRKPILLIGLSITLLGTLLCAIAADINNLLMGRLVQGIGFGTGSVIVRAILRDAFSGNLLVKMGSYVGIAASISIGLAPTLGGFIQQISHWRVNFIVVLFIMLFCIIYIYFYLPETNKQLDKEALNPKKLVKNYLTPLREPFFWGFSFVAGIGFAGFIVYGTMAPFVIQTQLGFTPAQFGLLSLFIAAAQILGFTINARLIDKLGIHNALRFGIAMMSLAGSVLVIATLLGVIHVWLIVFSTAMYTIGVGFVYANAFSGAFTPFKRIIGIVAALYGMMQIGWGFLVSTIVAAIPYKSALAMGIIFMVLGIMAFLALQFLAMKPAIGVSDE